MSKTIQTRILFMLVLASISRKGNLVQYSYEGDYNSLKEDIMNVLREFDCEGRIDLHTLLRELPDYSGYNFCGIVRRIAMQLLERPKERQDMYAALKADIICCK